MEVAVKRMAVPKSMHDRCMIHDIFTEIMVMDKFKNDPKIVHLYLEPLLIGWNGHTVLINATLYSYDYGVDEEHFWIIMRLYKDSLKGWRKRQKTPWYENLPLYLNIYEKVLETMLFLTQNRNFLDLFPCIAHIEHLIVLFRPQPDVNHYDLKCDNFLCHPLSNDISEDDFYDQPSDVPNFSICLAG